MTKAIRHFVWGSGGVGKSHVVLRLGYESAQKESTLVLTLDPSLRVFELTRNLPSDFLKFQTLALRAESLFDELDRRAPAKAHIRKLYLEMVRGLQHFREYLQLIQLCDLLEKSTASSIIIDTPPFQESGGLIKSMQSLHSFFQQTIVQWALKTSQLSILQFGVRRLFDLTRVFVGKRASESVFDLLEWLTLHTESFRRTTAHLEGLLAASETHHHIIVTPETSEVFFAQAKSSFENARNMHFIINRSAWTYPHRSWTDSFSLEMNRQIEWEQKQVERIRKLFPRRSIQRIPLMLMGDDSPEELMNFMRIKPQPLSHE